MEPKKKKKEKVVPRTQQTCATPFCFFCAMKEQDPCRRRAGVEKCFLEMPQRDDQEHVLVLSGLWNIAMAHPNDPEFPSLGIFKCMAHLISRGVDDRSWLLQDQNIYIPYYAAHIIGSYTMNEPEFATIAIRSGVIPPLLELLRGKLSWVEQRVAVRALGHLASYETTFYAVSKHEEEIVKLAMHVASTCLEMVYVKFVGVNDKKSRLRYQCDLLTRGMGGLEMENRKAEEWASQLQCWSLYLLNCFACKERALHLICRDGFLKELCKMWGGLVNDTSPSGVGLLRILCYSKMGRKCIADCREVIESLCNLSRSSDDWQYMAIDCLLLLIKDTDTRFKVMEIAAVFLADLVELKEIGGRKKVGEAIAQALLLDYKDGKFKNKKNRVLEEVWDLKVERSKREKTMSREEAEEKWVLAVSKKQQGNERFWAGDVEEAAEFYSEALDSCPLKMRKERMVVYSNRAQCYLLLREADKAVSDATRALCLATPANSHKKSLWRRSQAYDMKGLGKESLIDCVVFVNGWFGLNERKKGKVPYYASRMINKQMNATWLFAGAQRKKSNGNGGGDDDDGDMMKKDEKAKENMASVSGLSTIMEEPSYEKGRLGRAERSGTRKKGDATARSCLY
ncbi:uncharacterized protein LOC131229431 [Magnolia sinica]|uniref:uncharacterized protein LOC131229431 n=1 Tax=Magnolia sinica TaxID=86752 RepID=UPI00265A4869|nr:uncharacterized protein LOC131229431 [Magnolia sinica]